MKTIFKRIIVFLVIFVLFIPTTVFSAMYNYGSGYTWDGEYYGAYNQSPKDISIIYTNNINGNFAGKEDSGLSKAVSTIKSIKKEYPDSYLFDAGNFTLENDILSSDKTDTYALDVISKVNYDAVALGENELMREGLPTSIDNMVSVATKDNNIMPQILTSNVKLDSDSSKKIEENGAVTYKVIKKFNSNIAVFAVNDESASENLKKNKLELTNPKDAAQSVLDKIKSDDEKIDLVVCLYSGKSGDKGDSAEKLAQEVKGIDLIISGMHAGEAETKVGDTVVVGNSQNCENVGQVIFTSNNDNKFEFNSFKQVKIDSKAEDYGDIATVVSEHQNEYFKAFGFEANTTLADNKIKFSSMDNFAKEQGDDALGNLISDAYLYETSKVNAGGNSKAVCSVVASGAVKSSLGVGKITPDDVLSMFDKNAGTDKIAGIDLYKVYFSGAELRLMAEKDVSLSDEKNGLRLFTSGLNYEYNPSRFYLNHVSDYWYQSGKDRKEIDDDALYPVIMDADTLKLLKDADNGPFGLLDITFKTSDGNIINNFADAVIKTDGKNVKAWQAVAQYIYDKNISDSYAKPANHKILKDDSSLGEIFKNPGKTFKVALCVLIIGLVLLILLIVLIIHIVKKVLRIPPKSKYKGLYGVNSVSSSKQSPIFKHRRNRYRDKTRRKRRR